MSHAIALKRNDGPRKNARVAVFDVEGRKSAVTFPKSLFGDNVPTDLMLQSDAPFAEVKAPKPQETKEERKARLAAMPKLTPEQKLAKLKERTAKLEAKLAKASEPAAPVQ